MTIRENDFSLRYSSEPSFKIHPSRIKDSAFLFLKQKNTNRYLVLDVKRLFNNENIARKKAKDEEYINIHIINRKITCDGQKSYTHDCECLNELDKEKLSFIKIALKYNSKKELESKEKSKKDESVENAVKRMVKTAINTVRQSGAPTTTETKIKLNSFSTESAFSDYVYKLINSQKCKCALSGILLVLDNVEGSNSDFVASLDRIDSDGPYGPGNLQVVCRFINRWKSDSKDNHFRNLLSIVKGVDSHG